MTLIDKMSKLDYNLIRKRGGKILKNSEKRINAICKKIQTVISVYNALSDLNFGKVEYLGFPLVNNVSIICSRNTDLLNSLYHLFIKYLEYNEKFFNSKLPFRGDYLILKYLQRDFIENLEVFSYLKINSSDKNLVLKLQGKQRMKAYKFGENKEFEDELTKFSGEIALNDDFEKIVAMKRKCNDFIHKNGISYIIASYTEPQKSYIDNLCGDVEEILFIVKVFFKVMFFIEGHCISSSDYSDFLEMGEIPPENSQYWIASIYSDYIKENFDDNERTWLLEHNEYGMHFNF
jgi:hypothetical protein